MRDLSFSASWMIYLCFSDSVASIWHNFKEEETRAPRVLSSFYFYVLPREFIETNLGSDFWCSDRLMFTRNWKKSTFFNTCYKYAFWEKAIAIFRELVRISIASVHKKRICKTFIKRVIKKMPCRDRACLANGRLSAMVKEVIYVQVARNTW